MTLKEKSILFIGLRNSIGAARMLATEFRDAMKLQQGAKKQYNDLAAYLKNFSNCMIPKNHTLTADELKNLKGFDLDYTAILMSVAMQLAILDSESIPKFIDQLEELIDSYATKNKEDGNNQP